MSDKTGPAEVLAWLCTELERLHVKNVTYAGLSEKGALLLADGQDHPVSEVSIAHDTCMACSSPRELSRAWPCTTLRLVERAKAGISRRRSDVPASD